MVYLSFSLSSLDLLLILTHGRGLRSIGSPYPRLEHQLDRQAFAKANCLEKSRDFSFRASVSQFHDYCSSVFVSI